MALTGPAGPKGHLQGAGQDVGPESADAAETGGIFPPSRRWGRRPVIALLIIAAALGVLIFQGLGNATVYFKTADEAVAQRAALGSQRFRIEGIVQPGVRQAGSDVAFDIAANGAVVNVRHRGDPPQLFKAGIPVVLEGRFAPDGHFASTRILVKHTADYVAKYPTRVTTPAP